MAKDRSERLTAAARRAQLVEVGRGIFARRGYEAASVEEIAERAKVSKPIIYEHFGGKEGLYAVVVDREVEHIVGRIVEAMSSGSPRERLERARVEGARRRLEESTDGVKTIAAQCGFASAEVMRRAFLRLVGVPPSAYRGRFDTAARTEGSPSWKRLAAR